MRRTPLTDLLGTLKLDRKTLAYAGTALALTSIGGVTAAAATSAGRPSTVAVAGTSHSVSVGDEAGTLSGSGVTSPHPAASAVAPSGAAVAAAAQPAAHAARHTVRHAARHAKSPHVVRHDTSRSWKQIRDELASKTTPRAKAGQLPLADRLVIGPSSGAQSYLPMTSARMANATAIVRQALARHMGVRAAVIAVATAMQESGLENITYGDRDSLGLFQQRPSMGWGSAAQITTPSYAADAFLKALAQHQKADPGWAGQPLWATAQAVQRSGFPTAYAKWEKQAAQLVSAIATKLA